MIHKSLQKVKERKDKNKKRINKEVHQQIRMIKNLGSNKKIPAQRRTRPVYGDDFHPDGTRSISIEEIMDKYHGEIHHEIVNIGLKIISGKIKESNMICLSILSGLIKFTKDYAGSYLLKDKSITFEVDIQEKFKIIFEFLQKCKPLTIGIKQALKEISESLSKSIFDINNEEHKDLTEDEKVKNICEGLVSFLKTFANTKIINANKLVNEEIAKQITDRDVIVAYGNNYGFKFALLQAKENNIKFSVVILSENDNTEATDMVNYIEKQGIECHNYRISSLNSLALKVTKIFIEGSGMTNKGDLISKSGINSICEWAKSKSIPVYACIESYKISADSVDQSSVESEIKESKEKCAKSWQNEVIKSDLIHIIISENGCRSQVSSS